MGLLVDGLGQLAVDSLASLFAVLTIWLANEVHGVHQFNQINFVKFVVDHFSSAEVEGILIF